MLNLSQKPPFPLIWDNTMRSAFIECPQRFLWQYAYHLKPRGQSIHLHAGKAFASALEKARFAFYELQMPPAEAAALGLEVLISEYGTFDAPHGSNKTLDRMIEAYLYYFRAFPFESDPVQPYRGKDGKPMIEFSFALPLSDNLRHPTTNEPIIYTGRADMVATYAGAVSIYDDKTTSSLGSTWANQWNLRSQFTGYCWAARAFAVPVTQVVIRGIAILKTQINHAQAITVRTPAMIDRWHEQVIKDISRAKLAWENHDWDRNLADGCSAYGGCMFQQACISNDPAPWLETGFSVKIWNPLTREEEETPK